MKSPCIVTHVIILTADVFVDIEEMVEFPGRNYSYVTMEGNVSVVEGQILLQPTVFEIALQEKSAQGKIIVFRVIRFNNLHFTLWIPYSLLLVSPGLVEGYKGIFTGRAAYIASTLNLFFGQNAFCQSNNNPPKISEITARTLS